MNKFYLGNELRGFFAGEFSSIEDAWAVLSNRFLLSFPSKHGRYVSMYILEENKYGIEEWITCKCDITQINDLNKDVVLKQCKTFNPRLNSLGL